MKLITALFLLLTLVNGQEKYTTIKTSCIQQSEHSGKTLDQLKEILIGQAKQEALGELYGQLMYSKTDLTNGKIVSDEIRQRAVGSVRVEGNPKFYNGSDFGSICADVTSYITKKDLEKYSPKEVKLNRYCFNDSSVPMNKIKSEAKYGAYKEIISQYKPSLKLSNKQAEQFIHGFKISNDKFDFDTASYCFDAIGTILPYELEMGGSNKVIKNQKNSNSEKVKLSSTLKNGLVAYYKFEGNANDSSGNNNHGIEYGQIGYSKGLIGKALNIQFKNSNILANGNFPYGNASRSIATWVKLHSVNSDNDQHIVGFGEIKLKKMFRLSYGLGKSYNFGIWTYGCKEDIILGTNDFENRCQNSIGAPGDVIPNKYYFLVATHDGNISKIYVNGKLQGSKTQSLNTEKTTMQVNGRNGNNDDGFKGLLDDLRIYNRALSETEILELYNSQK